MKAMTLILAVISIVIGAVGIFLDFVSDFGHYGAVMQTSAVLFSAGLLTLAILSAGNNPTAH